MTTDEMFAVWYSEYPRHEARKDAHKAFLQAKVTTELFDVLMTALRQQKVYKWAYKDRQYIPLGASWLRGERWTDEVSDFVEVPRADRRFHRCDAICAESGCPLDPARTMPRGMR